MGLRSPRSRFSWASAQGGAIVPRTVVATGAVAVVALVVLVAGQLGLTGSTVAEASGANASGTARPKMWRLDDVHWLDPLLASAGWLAPVLFVAVFLFVTMFGVPRAVLTVAAGWAFGAWMGAVLAWGAGLGAAWAGYELARAVTSSRRAASLELGSAHVGAEASSAGPVGSARRLWRAAVHRLADAMDTQTSMRAGVFGVVSARLVPVLPFALVNYGCGAIKVSRRSFMLGSGLGLMPGAAAYAAIGAGLSSPGWVSTVTVAAGTVIGVVAVSAKVANGRRRTMHRRPCERLPSRTASQLADADGVQ